MVRAEHSIDGISTLGSKRIQALTDVLMGDAEHFIRFGLDRYLLLLDASQFKVVPLDGRTVFLRVHHKGFICVALIRAHNDVAHGLLVATFVCRYPAAFQFVEHSCLLHGDLVAD